MKKFKFIGNPDIYIWRNNPIKGKAYTTEEITKMRNPTSLKDIKLEDMENSITSWKDWEEVKEESTKAMRFNEGKSEYSLIDLISLKSCADVLSFGAKKYERDNWKKGFPISSILNSMLRHIAALQDGEWNDPESGLPHIGHIQCNALFLGCKNNTIDLPNLECCGDWGSDGKCKCKEDE